MSWLPTLTCLAIPLLVVFVVRRAYVQNRERAVLRTQHPDEQWLWRRDWASRTATDDHGRTWGPLLWLPALMWNLISLPGVFIMWERRDDPKRYLFAAFPIIGLLLIAAALYQTLRRRKYGVSVCRFDALPLAVGRTLHGEVESRVSDVPPNGFVVRLTCVRRVVTSSGKSTSTSERILWQEEQRVGAGAAMPNPNGVRVPFRFALPADAEVADERNPRDRVIWRLEVSADVPGIDYRGVFELPVFTRVEGHTSVFAPVVERAWEPPPAIAFGVDEHGAERITIKPVSTAFDWLFFLGFVPVWYGGLYFMYRMGVPAAVAIFFGIFGGVVLYFALDKLGGRSTIAANREQLTSRRTFFGTRVLATPDIASIAAVLGDNSGSRALYDIEARLNDGKKVKIAKHLRSRRDAEMVASRVERALGRS